MAESRIGPLGAGRAIAEGAVHQIVNGVVRELDINAIVEQVDIDALMKRVDVDAIVKRVDIAAIVDDIGLEDLVRQSTGVLASDSVKHLRIRTMNGDVLLSGFIDRVLRRNRPRHEPSSGATPGEAPPGEQG